MRRIHLEQPDARAPSQVSPERQLVFGASEDGRAEFTVSPSLGDEMVVVLASRSPLFDEPLPAGQNERDYLSALRKALLYTPDPSLPNRVVAAALLPIQTAR